MLATTSIVLALAAIGSALPSPAAIQRRVYTDITRVGTIRSVSQRLDQLPGGTQCSWGSDFQLPPRTFYATAPLGNNSTLCGACVEITNRQNPSRIVQAFVINNGGVGNTGVDVQPQGFDFLSDTDADIQGAWTVVPCAQIDRNIRYRRSPGSNAFNVRISVQYARKAIATVELAPIGTTNYVQATRTNDNFWVVASNNGRPFATSGFIRITAVDGEVITDDDVAIQFVSIPGSPEFTDSAQNFERVYQ